MHRSNWAKVFAKMSRDKTATQIQFESVHVSETNVVRANRPQWVTPPVWAELFDFQPPMTSKLNSFNSGCRWSLHWEWSVLNECAQDYESVSVGSYFKRVSMKSVSIRASVANPVRSNSLKYFYTLIHKSSHCPVLLRILFCIQSNASVWAWTVFPGRLVHNKTMTM